MGLKLIKDNGTVRRVWYGQYKKDGAWKVKKLTTPMRGTKIPDSLSGTGDAAFERSRLLAQAEFDEFERRRGIKGSGEELMKEIVESQTGKPVEYVRLDELAAKWRTLPRSYVPTEKCVSNADLYFNRFAEHAGCTYLYEVTQEMAASFFNGIRAEYSWSTVKSIMSILKSAFARFLPCGMVNPFSSVIKRNRELNAARVHRRPLSEAELDALFKESEKDPMLHSLTVATACTGMRIGDVCNLKWESVDLRGGFVTVLTAKAGKQVTIPILAPLRKILESAVHERDEDEPLVFPDAAQMYNGNPSGITRRGKVLFARALFAEDAEKEADITDADHKDKTPAEVLKCIRSAGYTKQKTERCEKVYTLYASGLTYRQIEHETGLSRGQIAEYLHGVEDITGNTIVRWAKECATSNRRLLKKTRQERKVGKRSASLYGWHSLRASFVVAALTHGIPIEVVRRVVGHSTVRMTEEYFNPTKHIMADTIRRKMQGSILAGDAPALAERAKTGIGARGTHTPLLARPEPTDATDGEIGGILAMVAKMSPAEREQLKALLDK